MTLKTLAMDSAAAVGCAALLQGDRVLDRFQCEGSQGHAALFPPRIQAMLNTADGSPAALDLITVTLGPGSFTGLRLALGLAKGMAIAQRIPVVGVSNLELLAAWAEEGWVAPLLDARRGELFAALYQVRKGETPQTIRPAGIVKPDRFAEELAAFSGFPIRLTGSGMPAHEALFRRVLGNKAVFLAEQWWETDAVPLARFGQACFRTQGSIPPPIPPPIPIEALEPIYLRRPHAETVRMEKKSGHFSGP